MKLNRSSVVPAILLLAVSGAVACGGDRSLTSDASVWGVERFPSRPGRASQAVGADQARWTARDLGTLGGRYSRALAINDRGQVVGVSRTASRARRYFLWEKGKMTDLGRASETQTQALVNEQGQVLVGYGTLWESGQMKRLPFAARAMNDRGQIVGQSLLEPRNAVLWDNGRLRDLGETGSTAVAINNDGLVAGMYYSVAGPGVFRWSNGKVSALTPLRGLPDCSVVAVNSSGQILGYCTDGTRLRAVIWHGSRRRDLGTLGHDHVWPESLNDRGQVVGRTFVNGRGRAFLWDGKKMRALWQLGESATVAINDRGQVVGSRNGDAVVWDRGVTTRLGRVGPLSASAAYAINENDQVVGFSMTGEPGSTDSPTYTAPRHAFLWTRADR